MLMFRSPKERTPEFYAPKITNDGHLLELKSTKPKSKGRKNKKIRMHTSLSKQERFLEYKYLSRITSK